MLYRLSHQESLILVFFFFNWRINMLVSTVKQWEWVIIQAHTGAHAHTHTHTSPPYWAVLPGPSYLSLPPFPPLQAITRHWAGLHLLHSSFPLVICFTYNRVYMSVPLSLSCPLLFLGFTCGQLVKNPPAMLETRVQSLDWEDPLEKGKAACCVYKFILFICISIPSLHIDSWYCFFFN